MLKEMVRERDDDDEERMLTNGACNNLEVTFLRHFHSY